MNEITKRLFDKALDKAVPETWTTLSHEQVTKLSQVLAELIVQECAQVCRDQPNHYALKADRDNCAIAIEEHFGGEK